MVALFYVTFYATGVCVVLLMVLDLIHYRKVQYITRASTQHELKIDTQEFYGSPLYTWLQRTDEEGLALFKHAQSVRAKYPVSDYMHAGVLQFAKSNPIMLGWLSWPQNHTVGFGGLAGCSQGSNRDFASGLWHFLSIHYEERKLENRQGTVEKEDLNFSSNGVFTRLLSFMVRDIHEQSRLGLLQEDAGYFSAWPKVFKQHAHASLLAVLCQCSDEECTILVRACNMILGHHFQASFSDEEAMLQLVSPAAQRSHLRASLGHSFRASHEPGGNGSTRGTKEAARIEENPPMNSTQNSNVNGNEHHPEVQLAEISREPPSGASTATIRL